MLTSFIINQLVIENNFSNLCTSSYKNAIFERAALFGCKDEKKKKG
jgi:hypothetical protein